MKIVITGGNRGIGLELVKQYEKLGHVVILMREKSAELSS